MGFSMKKSITLLLASITPILFADHRADNNRWGDDNKQNEEKIVHITPDAAPLVKGGANFFFTADFIYWTTRINGLDYARSGYQTPAINNLLPLNFTDVGAKGDTKTLPNEWDPGFKVGAGLTFKHDGWDLFLQYTWFQNNDKQTDSNGVWTPLWNVGNFRFANAGNFIGIYAFQNTSADWKLRFNNFDLELGRNFYISHYLKLRPHVGLKGYWQKQTYVVNYDTIANDAPAELDATLRPTLLNLNATEKHWGIGIRAGLNTAWQFNHNWSIFGDLALAALWGRFDVCRKDRTVWEVPSTDTTNDTTAFWSQRRFYNVNPVLELDLGLRYDYWFNNDNYHFGLQAGWEEQVWFDMNQMIYLLDADGSNGNMTFQGLTVKFRFDF